jgi:hypothetical protein
MAANDPIEADTDNRSSMMAAYRAGRDDERTRQGREPADPNDRRWRDAYERGRRDERARRRGSPLLTLVILIVAAVGVALVYLAAREGSFGRGGQVVDHTLSQATQQVRPAVGRAGNALEKAGRSLKDSSSGAGQS